MRHWHLYLVVQTYQSCLKYLPPAEALRCEPRRLHVRRADKGTTEVGSEMIVPEEGNISDMVISL